MKQEKTISFTVSNQGKSQRSRRNSVFQSDFLAYSFVVESPEQVERAIRGQIEDIVQYAEAVSKERRLSILKTQSNVSPLLIDQDGISSEEDCDELEDEMRGKIDIYLQSVGSTRDRSTSEARFNSAIGKERGEENIHSCPEMIWMVIILWGKKEICFLFSSK